MKFKNISDKTRMVKINNVWHNIKPGEIVDTPIGIRITSPYFEMVSKEEKVEDNLIPEEIPEVDEEDILPLSEAVLKKMKKDEINDYSAKRGWDHITTNWKKSKMIKEVLKLQNEEN